MSNSSIHLTWCFCTFKKLYDFNYLPNIVDSASVIMSLDAEILTLASKIYLVNFEN